jgi:hypothetical protein
MFRIVIVILICDRHKPIYVDIIVVLFFISNTTIRSLVSRSVLRLVLMLVSVDRSSSVDWAQLNRYNLRAETKSSLVNVVL